MKQNFFIKLMSSLFVCAFLITGFNKPAAGQEAQQPQQKTPQEVDTNGRFKVFLQGEYGFGFQSVDVGTTTSGQKVSISGGGGGGFGLGVGYGLSRDFDLDLTFGLQESVLSPSVANGSGSFTRSFLLATIKGKIPTSDTGQFKIGAGLGVYSGGKLDIDTTDAGGNHSIIKYDQALGFHITGEFERFIAKDTSLYLGGKFYFVKYKADSAEQDSVSIPVDGLSGDVKELNGDGFDVVIGVNQYF